MDKDLQKQSDPLVSACFVDVAVCAIVRFPGPTDLNLLGHGGPEPHLLITKRLANTFYPGYWELPGGKLDPGEAPAAAAVREAREELGVEVAVDAVLEPIEHVYDHARVRLFTCVGRLTPGSAAPRDLQVAAHAWCRLDDLPWEEFLPANVRVITALRRHLDAARHAPQRGPSERRQA